jgi:hypothetical protein
MYWTVYRLLCYKRVLKQNALNCLQTALLQVSSEAKCIDLSTDCFVTRESWSKMHWIVYRLLCYKWVLKQNACNCLQIALLHVSPEGKCIELSTDCFVTRESWSKMHATAYRLLCYKSVLKQNALNCLQTALLQVSPEAKCIELSTDCFVTRESWSKMHWTVYRLLCYTWVLKQNALNCLQTALLQVSPEAKCMQLPTDCFVTSQSWSKMNWNVYRLLCYTWVVKQNALNCLQTALLQVSPEAKCIELSTDCFVTRESWSKMHWIVYRLLCYKWVLKQNALNCLQTALL